MQSGCKLNMKKLRVIAGNLAAGQSEVVRIAAADLEIGLGHRNDAPAEGIGHFQTSVGHGSV